MTCDATGRSKDACRALAAEWIDTHFGEILGPDADVNAVDWFEWTADLALEFEAAVTDRGQEWSKARRQGLPLGDFVQPIEAGPPLPEKERVH